MFVSVIVFHYKNHTFVKCCDLNQLFDSGKNTSHLSLCEFLFTPVLRFSDLKNSKFSWKFGRKESLEIFLKIWSKESLEIFLKIWSKESDHFTETNTICQTCGWEMRGRWNWCWNLLKHECLKNLSFLSQLRFEPSSKGLCSLAIPYSSNSVQWCQRVTQ